MTKEKKGIDLDSVIKSLEQTTERPAAEIKAEIEGLMQKFGYNLPGAIATWKSDNKFLIALDRKEYTVRVIAKELPRTSTTSDGQTQPVGNIHFLYHDPETKEVALNQTTCWGDDRIKALYGAMELGQCYKFKARVNEKKYLAWIRSVEPATGAPEIADVDGMPIADIVNVIDQYELVKGFVGRIIEKNGVKLGFEVDDIGNAPPLTIWYSGGYTKMNPQAIDEVNAKLIKGIEVAVYGYVSGLGPDIRMSASSIWFL